jgi:hypothetical protein
MSNDKKANSMTLAITDSEIDSEKKDVICENCHSQVIGSFCSQCGQSVESTLKYFWTVLLHLLDDIFSFDSRASRTLKPLLLTPGFLTNEYIQGRRVHYVPPLRLYLFVSIIFFISLKFFTIDGTDLLVHEQRMAAPIKEVSQYIKQLEVAVDDLPIEKQNEQLKKIQQYKQYQQDLSALTASKTTEITKKIVEYELGARDLQKSLSEKDMQRLAKLKEQLSEIKSGKVKQEASDVFSISNNQDGTLTFDFLSDENNQRLSDKMKALEKKGQQAFNSDARPLIQQSISKLPQLMFILLPLFALILKLFYLFSKRLYLEHLTVALHSHSFIFLIILLVNILDNSQEYLSPTMPKVASWLGYAAIALLTWLPCYLFLMQKRVYKQGYIFSFIKFSIIGLIYFNLIALTAMAAFIWGLTDI